MSLLPTAGHAETEKPVIVIVPASFSPLSLYTKVVEGLDREGYSAVLIQLPSVGTRASLPGATMTEDAEYIKNVTTELADRGENVVLVMHSYGGICGTESTKGVTDVERRQAQKKGGITGLLYISSPVPALGGSIATQMGGNMPGFITVDGDYMIAEPEGCANTNFSDLPPAEGVECAKQMLAHSAVSFTGTLTHPGHRHVPISYLVCEEDRAVPVELQKSVIARIEQESGHKVDIHTCKAGHFPSVSRPEEVVRVIRCAAGEMLG